MNVEDDIDFSSTPAPTKKNELIQRGKRKQNKATLLSTQPGSTNDNSNMNKTKLRRSKCTKCFTTFCTFTRS